MSSTDTMTQTWSDVIRRYRELLDLSRPDLARLTGLSAAVIEKYELAGTRPSIDAARSLDDALSAGGAVLTACGFTPPMDWGRELDQLRDRLAQLAETVESLARKLSPEE